MLALQRVQRIDVQGIYLRLGALAQNVPSLRGGLSFEIARSKSEASVLNPVAIAAELEKFVRITDLSTLAQDEGKQAADRDFGPAEILAARRTVIAALERAQLAVLRRQDDAYQLSLEQARLQQHDWHQHLILNSVVFRTDFTVGRGTADDAATQNNRFIGRVKPANGIAMMKWLWVFLAAIAGALAGATLLQDPGYVLVRAGDLVLKAAYCDHFLTLLAVLTVVYAASMLLAAFCKALVCLANGASRDNKTK